MPIPDRTTLRVPPDGAGKALGVGHVFYIRYNAGTSLTAFSIGDTVIGGTSGLQAEVLLADPETSTTGRICVSVAFADLEHSFADGENLLVGGAPKAVVAEVESLYVSRTQVVGANNPNLGQHVDVEGAASVRFAEGAPNLDASGRTEVSRRGNIATYSPTYGVDESRISFVSVSGGAQAYEAEAETLTLSVGTTDGAMAQRTTNLYHKYQAGVSQVAEMTITPHAPKANVVRRWGYYDDDNGVFFEESGGTMWAVLRTSVHGAMNEHRIPQSEWNGDRLDGSGNINSNPSWAQFDPEEMYLFGFNFLYLGAGRVRFTIAVGGARVTVHTHTGGDGAYPYMGTATLPMRWEIYNTGVTASSSELRVGNAHVSCEADFDPQRTLQGSGQLPVFAVSGTDYLCPYLIRATQTLFGKDNRVAAVPTKLTVYSTTEPLFLRILEDGVYDTVTEWYRGYPPQDIALEAGLNLAVPGDLTSAVPLLNVPEASGFPSGNNRFATMVPAGQVYEIDLSEAFNARSNSMIHRKADITEDPVTYGVVVNSLTGQTTDVHMNASWHEIR